MITGVVDYRSSGKENSFLDGFVIQDGCIPQPFAPIIQIMFMLQMIRQWFSGQGGFPSFRQIVSSTKSLVLGAYVKGGAIQRTATYLVMSHDSNQITLTLEDDNVKLSSPGEGHSSQISRIQKRILPALSNSGTRPGYSYFYGTAAQHVAVQHS